MGSKHTPIVFSLEHALVWTNVEAAPDPVWDCKVDQSLKGVYVFACASANVLTLHPPEERQFSVDKIFDSHRRLDLASQFAAAKLVRIGLRETRLKVARATGIAQYLVFAAAANARGQGGINFGSCSRGY